MITFENVQYNDVHFDKSDLFVCVIGYEERSFYMLDRIREKIGQSNTLLFVMDDYFNFEQAQKKVEQVKNDGYPIEVVNYQDATYVAARIVSAIEGKKAETTELEINIDYSSMPRGWYSVLPARLDDILREKDRVYFWYCEGNYPENYDEYPTAGIEAISLFSGKSSMRMQKRTHVIGLSYDMIRTQGIISVIDPEYIVTCEAHDPIRKDIQKNVIELNQPLLAQASMSVSLDLSDFVFMVSKLREIANELLKVSDVILVPDGPKPLIFAMSIIPSLLDEPGVACLHVSRNKNYYKPVNVKPTGRIVGFGISASRNRDAM